ncbi:WXG100 family type VII secretion target [Solihabitans fulvus]|uniref:WXG100 family type VII secretion target n=1 Tax=Solihabitans fulvus TaxID=1892852 RepID=A0A5B2XMQ3_9PSEU|nr:WXG100 family type VII secretion target [Solihabitans fulvus]KAA2264072.1 WXG100 family type VII secretion target [Solihabitans fulvus]
MFGGLFDFVTQAAKEFAAGVAESRGRERSDDRYVPGGTHWDGYSHSTLFEMVWKNADPAHVESLAETWRQQGSQITEKSYDLQRSLATLMQYWSGSAADQAASTVQRNAGWLSQLGGTATKMSMPLDHAAGALRSAQTQMPAPPDGFSWSSLFGGAAGGFAVGGPIGAGIGAMIGGIGSLFGGASKRRKLKRRAVQTMERFENAGQSVDSSTPQFGGPSNASAGGAGGPGSGPRGGVGTLPGGGIHNQPGWSGPDPTHDSDYTGSRMATVPSFAGGGDARWGALTGGYGSGFGDPLGSDFARRFGLGGGGAGAGGAGGFGGMAGALPMGGIRSGVGGRGGMGAGIGMRGAGAGGRLGSGSGAGGPWGAGGRRGEDEDDLEHKRRFPFEDDPFEDDQLAAPPVIGG